METNYRIAYQKFWQDIKERQPEEIVSAREVLYNNETGRFLVKFFDEEYIVDSNEESIYRKSDGFVPNIMDSIVILNYLAYANPLEKSEPRWVSLKEMPGVMIFYPAFHKLAILPLINTFGKNSNLLAKVAPDLRGQAANIGHNSAIFKAFPEIPLCVVVWEGDEEVNGNATILYDPSIEPMLHGESIIGLGMSLADKLVKLAKNK